MTSAARRDGHLELARRRVGNRALAAEASRRHGCACLPLARRRPLRQLNHVAEDGHAREIASDVRLLERLLLAAHFVPHLQVHAFGRERLGGDGQGDRRRVGAGADRLQVHRGETTRLARLPTAHTLEETRHTQPRAARLALAFCSACRSSGSSFRACCLTPSVTSRSKGVSRYGCTPPLMRCPRSESLFTLEA